MTQPRRPILLLLIFAGSLLTGACRTNPAEKEVISDAKAYLALMDAGDYRGANELRSSVSRRFIPDAAFIDAMKSAEGGNSTSRSIRVAGMTENMALVEYEVRYGTAPWGKERSFFAKESGHWLRAYDRNLFLDYEKAMDRKDDSGAATVRGKILDICPEPDMVVLTCSEHSEHGDLPAALSCYKKVLDLSTTFPGSLIPPLVVIARTEYGRLLVLHAASLYEQKQYAAAASEAALALSASEKLEPKVEAALLVTRASAKIKAGAETDLASIKSDLNKARQLCGTGPQSICSASIVELLSGFSEMTPSTSPLGGGYKGIKWGSTQKQVIQGLGMKPKTSTADALIFKYGKVDGGPEKELTCLFYKGQLFGVLFEPGLSDGDQQGAIAISQALVEKYGKAEEVTGLVDGVMGLPLIASEWNDRETRIRATMMDPEKLEQGLRSVGGGGNRLGFPSSTLKVVYSSIAIAARKKQEEQESKAHAEKDEQQRKKAKFSGDL